MIYLFITFAGLLLVIAGLYAMSFGFSTPPNLLMFLLGLFSFVLGVMLVILFATKIDMASFKRSKPETRAAPVKERAKVKKSANTVTKAIKPKKIQPPMEKPKKPAKVVPKKVPSEKVTPKNVSPEKISPERVVKKKKVVPTKKMEKTEPEPTKKIKPAKSPRKFLKLPKFGKKDKSKEISEPSEKVPTQEAKPKTSSTVTPEPEDVETKPKTIRPQRIPRRPPMAKPEETISAKTGPGTAAVIATPSITKEVEKSGESDKVVAEKVEKEKPMEPLKPIKPVKKIDKNDTHYVKERLNKLKQDYIENVDDVEDLIEERLDSFRGAINKIRAESMEPSIIWSFDASDVQEAMKETILKADSKVIMMYPWIRNIDVSVLKKFMDTESRLIIQEASLDDDASVELMKVLQDNSVQIKTMPHIHTVAVVSDDNHGLIISTDPIYESFEVGVIYKDEKSISEIEKLFEEAWKLSNEVTLEETG